METETETATSTESRGSEKKAQSAVDDYVNEIIDFVIDHPFASIPQMFAFIAQGGP